MRKIISIMVMFMMTLSCTALYGQSIAKQLKNEKKAMEADIKQFKKEGWTPLDGKGLASVVAEHYAKTNANPNLMPITHISKPCVSMILGKTETRNAAINEYVEYCGGMVRGRITSDLYDVNEVQADNLVAGYERILSMELKKVIKPSYFLSKMVGGKFVVRGTYLINEEDAERASKKALEQAAEEAGIAFNHGDDVKGFIDGGFKN